MNVGVHVIKTADSKDAADLNLDRRRSSTPRRRLLDSLWHRPSHFNVTCTCNQTAKLSLAT